MKKVAAFDIDGTIFRNSLLIELHWKMVKEGIIQKSAIKKLDALYWRWVERKGHYDEYLTEVIRNYDAAVVGQPVKKISNLARQVVKTQSQIVYRYTRDLVEQLRAQFTLVAISGSPIEIVKEFARAWKFDYYVGTEHETREGKFTNRKPFIGSRNKFDVLSVLCQEHNLSLKGSIGVGDTKSDIGLFERVENPICFNPDAELYAAAIKKKWPIVVERKDVIYFINKKPAW